MSVKLSTRQVGDVNVIDAAGRITLGEAASSFRDEIRNLANKGEKKLLLNLSAARTKKMRPKEGESSTVEIELGNIEKANLVPEI